MNNILLALLTGVVIGLFGTSFVNYSDISSLKTEYKELYKAQEKIKNFVERQKELNKRQVPINMFICDLEERLNKK